MSGSLSAPGGQPEDPDHPEEHGGEEPAGAALLHPPSGPGTDGTAVQPQGETRVKALSHFISVLRIRIRTDPHLKMPSGSGWRDADPDPEGKKA